MKPYATHLIAPYISEHGPISIAEYMELVLDHSEHGYYRVSDPFGEHGDFTTAPEISQLFGEIIGIWCIETWQALDRPDVFSLVELGPGKGTLMADILRAARIRPEFEKAANIHLVDKNVTLKSHQKRRLEDLENVKWHHDFPELPNNPLIIIANEFFDCLPIRQFVLTERGWRERGIDANENSGELQFVLLDKSVREVRLPSLQSDEEPVGLIKEYAPYRNSYMTQLAQSLAKRDGRGLIIDYGYAQSGLGETLQAVKNHRYADVLSYEYDRDVTAHVDFEALVNATHDTHIESFGPVTQREFLMQMGIGQRAQRLMESATARQAQDIASGLDRLISTAQMGSLFKVLAFSSLGLGRPPGF